MLQITVTLPFAGEVFDKMQQSHCINFKSLGYGDLRIGSQYITKTTLEALFQLSNCVVADDQGDEIVPQGDGTYPGLDSSKTYTVVDEQDLAEDESGTKILTFFSTHFERCCGLCYRSGITRLVSAKLLLVPVCSTS